MYVSIFVFFLALNYPSLKKLEKIIVEGIFILHAQLPISVNYVEYTSAKIVFFKL